MQSDNMGGGGQWQRNPQGSNNGGGNNNNNNNNRGGGSFGGDRGGGRGGFGNQNQTKNICFDFQNTGSCKKGSSCKYQHVQGNNNNNNNNNQNNNNNPGNDNNNRMGGGQQQQKKGPCKFFMQSGNCKKGDNCPFSHDSNNNNNNNNNDIQAPQVQNQNKKPCLHFAKGNCKNGNDCRFSHDGQQQQSGNCTFQRNWGQCNCGGQHSWNKSNNIQLVQQFQVPNQEESFIQIIKINSENTLLLLAQNKITIIKFERDQSGNFNMQEFGTIQQFAVDGYAVQSGKLFGNSLVLSAKKQNSNFHSIIFINLLDNAHIYINDAHQKEISGLYFSEQAKVIFSCSLDGTIKVWNYNGQSNSFVIDQNSMEQFKQNDVSEFTCIEYHLFNNIHCILAGTKNDQGIAGVAIYSIGQQIKLEGFIATFEENWNNSVRQISKVDDDIFAINVLHQQKQQNNNNQRDYSQLFMMSLQAQKAAPVYPPTNNNGKNFSNLFTCMNQCTEGAKKDLIILGTSHGTFFTLENDKINRSEVQQSAMIKAHGTAKINDIQCVNFQHNAINFIYFFVSDEQGNLSIWSYTGI